MTRSHPWPAETAGDSWIHLRAESSVLYGQGEPRRVVDLWTRGSEVVAIESVDGATVREVRVSGRQFATLDDERNLCLVKTGLDPSDVRPRAFALVVGPAAELYGDAELPAGWFKRRLKGRVRYYNRGPGTLRQATIDDSTDLPLEAITIDGTLRWVFERPDFDSPPSPPNVTEWAKESHERREISAVDNAMTEHISYRTSSADHVMDFVVHEADDGTVRAVVRGPAAGFRRAAGFEDTDQITVLAGDPAIARAIVADILPGEADEQETESQADWDSRINSLVHSIGSDTK